MTDEERTDFAIRTAQAALAMAGGDHVFALTALFHAAATVMIAKYTPGDAVEMMAQAGPEYARYMAEQLGVKASRQ